MAGRGTMLSGDIEHLYNLKFLFYAMSPQR